MSDRTAYRAAEIDRALAGTPEDHHLVIKIHGDLTASKYLNVSPAEVRAIKALLMIEDQEGNPS